MAESSKTCEKPDREMPGLVCGYPLPCPHHTDAVVVVKPEGEDPEIHAARPLSPKTVQRLDKIGRALAGKPKRRRKRRRK